MIERTKFRFTAATPLLRSLEGSALADLARAAKVVPRIIEKPIMAWIITQIQASREVLVMS